MKGKKQEFCPSSSCTHLIFLVYLNRLLLHWLKFTWRTALKCNPLVYFFAQKQRPFIWRTNDKVNFFCSDKLSWTRSEQKLDKNWCFTVHPTRFYSFFLVRDCESIGCNETKIASARGICWTVWFVFGATELRERALQAWMKENQKHTNLLEKLLFALSPAHSRRHYLHYWSGATTIRTCATNKCRAISIQNSTMWTVAAMLATKKKNELSHSENIK